MTAVHNIGRALASGCGLAVALTCGVAGASNGLESPEAGSNQVTRGGAWLARADDATAAYFNPAALVRQTSSVHLGAQLMMTSYCFDRRGANGQPISPGNDLAPPPGEVCADTPPFPNPQLAASFRLHKRFALGLAVLGPHSTGNVEWPETITYADRFGDTPHPAPNRYLLLKNNTFALFPTLSGSFAINRNLSVGAGFVWGVVALDFSNMAEAASPQRDPSEPDDFTQDIRSQITGVDAFVPGFVASVQWSPLRWLDIAAWYRFSDKVRTKFDLLAQSNYYANGGAVAEGNLNDPSTTTDVKEAGTFQFRIPMEARLGFRYHMPRGGRPKLQKWVSKHRGWARDPMATDLFDVEIDLTWAHNSTVDTYEVRVNPGINIVGTPGTVPENADQDRQWRDVLGVRLGGEYVVIPDFFALRLGGFFESKGVDDEYLTTDFHQGERIGVGGGAALRLSRFDISLGYQHTHFVKLDNGGNGKVHTLSGDATAPNSQSRQAVNGGSLTQSLNEISLGAGVRF